MSEEKFVEKKKISPYAIISIAGLLLLSIIDAKDMIFNIQYGTFALVSVGGIIGWVLIACGILTRTTKVIVVGAIVQLAVTFKFLLDLFSTDESAPILAKLIIGIPALLPYVFVIVCATVATKKKDSKGKKVLSIVGILFSIIGWGCVYALTLYAVAGMVAVSFLIVWLWKTDLYVQKNAVADVTVMNTDRTEEITEESTEQKMKYCSHCGKEILAAAVICPHCGCQVEGINLSHVDDKPSTGLNILSLFFPLVGLILFIVYQEKTPRKAKAIGKFALIGFIIGIVAAVIYYVSVIGLIMSY